MERVRSWAVKNNDVQENYIQEVDIQEDDSSSKVSASSEGMEESIIILQDNGSLQQSLTSKANPLGRREWKKDDETANIR
jgi:hypothetical protein